MKSPAPHRFNISDYHRLGEAGVLEHNARVELLDGQIHDMSPIGPLHGGVTKRLSRLFTLLANGRWIVSVQDPVCLDRFSEPQPDVMLLKPAPDDYTTHHPVPDDVLLVVEVADSSIDYDREIKLPVYARFAIPEVWIVNLNESLIEMYREPHLSCYSIKRVLRAGERLHFQAFPEVVVDIAELLRRP